MMESIDNPDVAAVFAGYPADVRKQLLALRSLILETAEATDGVGSIEETLKWGEPAYVTAETRSGSTVRIGWKPSAPDRYAVHFNCQTTLVEDFRGQFPEAFRYEGNRAIVFDKDDPVPRDLLAFCIAAALTYRHNKKRRR